MQPSHNNYQQKCYKFLPKLNIPKMFRRENIQENALYILIIRKIMVSCSFWLESIHYGALKILKRTRCCGSKMSLKVAAWQSMGCEGNSQETRESEKKLVHGLWGCHCPDHCPGPFPSFETSPGSISRLDQARKQHGRVTTQSITNPYVP